MLPRLPPEDSISFRTQSAFSIYKVQFSLFIDFPALINKGKLQKDKLFFHKIFRLFTLSFLLHYKDFRIPKTHGQVGYCIACS